MAMVKVTISTLDGEVLDTFTVSRERLDRNDMVESTDNIALEGTLSSMALKDTLDNSLSIVEAREERGD